MKPCLVCDRPIEPFLSFGKMPIANGFLLPDQFADEYFFELKVAFCENCRMVQLAELVERERMFHENYAFFSSTSTFMAKHFEEFASWVKRTYLTAADPFVVEMGSNDGIMLRHFADAGIRHLGIEPSANVAEVAQQKGVQTVSQFFDEELAMKILEEHGPADAFLGANVMCHIPYIHSVFAGIKKLLKPRGILAFEDPYLGDIVEKTSYDQIYDEHAFYFSAESVSFLAGLHELELIDVLPQAVHGGSMRYVLGHRGAYPVSAAVDQLRDKEASLGLVHAETYAQLRRNIESSRDELRGMLEEFNRKGSRVAGYAATSKSTTVTNYCGLTPALVEFISDTTPIKQGKFSPGAHIPVRPYEEFKANYPDYGLLFGWNHAEEIMAKEQAFRAAGGKWIVYADSAGSSLISCGNPRAQYESRKTAIDTAVRRVLERGRYILGDEVVAFEREFADYIGVRYAVGVGSGTEALHLALAACGIGAGDEVITVAHTAVATVAAIELAGATPILVDIEPDYFTLDPLQLEAAITPRTKAIIPVHIYGQPADLAAIGSVAERYGIRVIEDCAQAHGATFRERRVGSWGDIACFSFYPTKNLGAIGDAGAVTTNNSALAERVRQLREYGWTERNVSRVPGWNSRLDELQAAILRVKLRYLDADNVRRRAVAGLYDSLLADFDLVVPARRADATHVFHLYVVRSDERDDLLAALRSNDVGALVHYPSPVHLQPAYFGRFTGAENLPNTERVAKEIVSLPIYPELTDVEVRKVAAECERFCGVLSSRA